MMDKVMEKDSKFLSYLLRHNPAEAGCEIDKYGWVSVKNLCRNTKFTLSYLEEIVSEDTRYEFNSDQTKIRAFHGHSVDVFPYVETKPPSILYHGTSVKAYEDIKKDGFIRKMSRVLVHLSPSMPLAYDIGKRHGEPIILVIDVDAMLNDGIKFYESGDNVYLTEDFSVKYIKEIV